MSSVSKMLSKVRDDGGMDIDSLNVSVYVPSENEPAMPMEDTKWLKKDLRREKRQVAKYESLLNNWIPEEVAEKAREHVEMQLKECRLRIKDLKARLKLYAKEGK